MKMKYNKITINLVALLLVLFATSCKKEKIGPAVDEKETQTSYYVKFKVDGVQKIFKKDAFSLIYNAENRDKVMQYDAILNGNAIELDTSKNGLTIFMVNSKEIKTGEAYVNFFNSKPNTETAKLIWIIYKDENGIDYMSMGDELSTLFNVNSDGQIKFSEINSKYTKGVFSATVYNSIYTKSKKITDGEFYLERQIVSN